MPFFSEDLDDDWGKLEKGGRGGRVDGVEGWKRRKGRVGGVVEMVETFEVWGAEEVFPISRRYSSVGRALD